MNSLPLRAALASSGLSFLHRRTRVEPRNSMAKADDSELLEVAGRAVRISNPSKPYFTRGVQLKKLDIVHYFLSVAPGALRGIVDRPIVLKRFVNGAEAEPFYQKRAPSDLPG